MRAWEEFLTHAEKELGLETVTKWLRPLKIVRFDACNLYLEAPDSFKALWFEEHMAERAHLKLVNNNNKQIKVHLSIAASPEIEKKTKKKEEAPQPFKILFDEVDEKALFETFIAHDGTRLGLKLLTEAAMTQKNTAPSFNPIYLFGRKGTGKTHLLLATANAFRKRGLNALYVKAETFTEHVVGAIRTGEMQHFRKAYRGVDALLLDDIEVFARKGATQEEFFHTFNTLHVEGKQIVLSASTAPQELKFIEPRLVSRFEWGIVVPILCLEKEQMKELLISKAVSNGFTLNEGCLEFLLETFTANTKTLLRAFDALVLRTHLHKTYEMGGITATTAKKLLSDLIQEEERALVTPTKIIKSVADHYGIRIDDILGKAQTRDCAIPRQIAMHLCRQKLNLPYMKIGDIFSRDHSTVMASVKHVNKLTEEKNPEITTALAAITKRLDQ